MGEIIEDLESEMIRIAELLNDICNNSEEQHIAIKQINESIADLNNVIGENSERALNLAGTSRSLSELSEDLKRIVSYFVIK